jgi:hypothetical protein
VCAKRGERWHGKIEAEVLTLAIKHVAACCEAADYLESLSDRARIASEVEILLAHIRHDLKANSNAEAIYCTRTDLTKRFCNNSRRAGSLTPDDLYLRLIPELERRGLATLSRKRGEGAELYAFIPERH